MFRVSFPFTSDKRMLVALLSDDGGNGFIGAGIKATSRRYNREAIMSPKAPLLKDALPCPPLAPRSQCITFFDSGSPRCWRASRKNVVFPR